LLSQELMTGNSRNMKLTPILAPLVVSGVNSGVLQGMQHLFNAYGLYPVQGGNYISVSPLSGKGGSISEKAKLVPGASVAAILVKGDLSAAVVGTVTYVEGDNVLAFGHPFFANRDSRPPHGVRLCVRHPHQPVKFCKNGFSARNTWSNTSG